MVRYTNLDSDFIAYLLIFYQLLNNALTVYQNLFGGVDIFLDVLKIYTQMIFFQIIFII